MVTQLTCIDPSHTRQLTKVEIAHWLLEHITKAWRTGFFHGSNLFLFMKRNGFNIESQTNEFACIDALQILIDSGQLKLVGFGLSRANSESS